MEVYTARLVSTIFSVIFVVTASTLILIHHHEQSGVNDDLDRKFNEAKATVSKEDTETKPKLGELVYHDSELYKHRRKFLRELKLAEAKRKKECGVYVRYSAIDCDICILFVHGLKFLAEKNSTQEDVADFSKRVCTDLKIEDARVCAAITQEFKVICALRYF